MPKITLCSNSLKLINQPDIRWQSRNEAVLMSDWEVQILIDGEMKTFVIKKGFSADGSSVSSLSSLIGIPADGRNRTAWLLHDYLYETKKIKDRKLVDQIFRELLIQLGMGLTRSWIAYYAVRAFGWTYWRG